MKVSVEFEPFDVCPPGMVRAWMRAVVALSNSFGFQARIHVYDEGNPLGRFFAWQEKQDGDGRPPEDA